MRHAQSRNLHAYWQTRRNGQIVPLRADIEPQDISNLLEYVFILKRIDSRHHVFSLAGTGLCALYGREFRDQTFSSLWRGHAQQHVELLLESVLATASPASATAKITNLDLHPVQVEISLFPLLGRSGQVNRILGLFQPLTDCADFRRRPITRTDLKEVRPPALQSQPGVLRTAAKYANDR